MLYYPDHFMWVVEIGNARFIENGEISKSSIPWQVEIKEDRIQIPLTCPCDNKVNVRLIIMIWQWRRATQWWPDN